MTEQPNIKLEMLEYVLEHDEDSVPQLRDFAEERGYSEQRVANKVGEMGDILEYGVSPMCPWVIPGKGDEARKQYDEWK